MNDKISHSGVVESAADGVVRVRILQATACSSCKVAKHCHASEAREKTIDVSTADASVFRAGQPVTVCASRGVASLSLLLGFGLPLAILVATVVVASVLSLGEGTAAVASLALLAVYYLVLWLLRGSISRRISFYIEE